MLDIKLDKVVKLLEDIKTSVNWLAEEYKERIENEEQDSNN